MISIADRSHSTFPSLEVKRHLSNGSPQHQLLMLSQSKPSILYLEEESQNPFLMSFIESKLNLATIQSLAKKNPTHWDQEHLSSLQQISTGRSSVLVEIQPWAEVSNSKSRLAFKLSNRRMHQRL